MAIATVFAIPELLEDIILQTYEDDFRPLFQLQRVSKGFFAVVAGSNKLQRLMFMAPGPPDYTLTLPQHRPVLWLFRDLLSLNVWPVMSTRRLEHRLNVPAITLCRSRLRRAAAVPTLTIRSKNNPMASWRMMPIANVEKPMTLSMHFLVNTGDLTIDGHVRHFYGIFWRFKSDATLGEVFDRYLAVFDLSEDQHVHAARSYWAKSVQQQH